DLHSLPGSAGKFATAMQAFPAESYRGKRMRLSAQIKSYDVRGWAGLWMRIDGDGDPPQTLAFDNMQKRPIKGTTAWRTYEVVLDVAPTAKTVNFGFLLNGEGRVQATAFDLQPVNQRVKPTN
ncbi:MAG: AraC family transcriptional regulator, partial [Armatimonadetes bacterium]|nr:AraC family transcriptional regulator [Armatimonadota bacterium]